MHQFGVLFVCTGNICRSPLAEGQFRDLVQREGLASRVRIDSAGTFDFHAGSPPDERAQAAALRHGFDISDLGARMVEADDFERFDLVLALDTSHVEYLRAICPPIRATRLRYLMDFAPGRADRDVPDPYLGDDADFDHVLELTARAMPGLLAFVTERSSQSGA